MWRRRARAEPGGGAAERRARAQALPAAVLPVLGRPGGGHAAVPALRPLPALVLPRAGEPACAGAARASLAGGFAAAGQIRGWGTCEGGPVMELLVDLACGARVWALLMQPAAVSFVAMHNGSNHDVSRGTALNLESVPPCRRCTARSRASAWRWRTWRTACSPATARPHSATSWPPSASACCWGPSWAARSTRCTPYQHPL